MQNNESLSEDLEDPEIEKIKQITSALKSNLSKEIITHRSKVADYLESGKTLNIAAKEYQNEVEEIKLAASTAFELSYKTQSDLAKIRESFISKESKHTENEINSQTERKMFELLEKMKIEVEALSEKLYQNELYIEEKSKENNDLRLIISAPDTKLELESNKSSGCGSCIIH